MKMLLPAPVLMVTVLAVMMWHAPVAAADAQAAGVDDPRAQLEQIMDDPLFQRWQRRQMRAQREGESGFKWYTDVLERMGEQLGRALRWLFDRGSTSRSAAQRGVGMGVGIGTFMLWLGWAIAAVLVIFVLVTLARLMLGRRRGAEATTVSRVRMREALETGEALAAESPQWFEEADRLAASNDLRMAYRAMYLSLLAGLHEQQKIDFRRHRTNWSYVRQYHGPDEQRTMLAELTAAFDETWYGQHVPDRPAFERVRDRVRALLEQEPSHA